MILAVGADHAGFELKEMLAASLESSGHEVRDLGTHSLDSTDYPDYAAANSTSAAPCARTWAGAASRLSPCGSKRKSKSRG